MMNQTNSGFLNSIPPVTKNLIIINLLFWVASLALPKVGIDLVDLLGLHFPGATDFKAYQIVSISIFSRVIPVTLFMKAPFCALVTFIFLTFICSAGYWRTYGAPNVF